MKIFVLILSVLSITSCGKLDDLAHGGKTVMKVEPAQEEAYSYQLSSKGCSTGTHEFQSFLAACQGLRDDDLNNNCALEEREELFINSECQGAFI